VSHSQTKFWQKVTVQTIAVGLAGAAWITRSPEQKKQLQSMSWAEHSSLTQAIDVILSSMNLQQSSKLQWVVAPSVLKHWLQQAPVQIQSLKELHAVTVQRAQQLFGLSSAPQSFIPNSTWVVSANWDVSQAFLSSAIPSIWHAALTDSVDPRSIRPSNICTSITNPLKLILLRFQKQLPSNGWLAVAAANTLYLMHFNKKTCLHFRSLQLEAVLSVEDIETIALTEWQRDMLRTQLTSDRLHWLCMMPLSESVNVKSSLLSPIERHSKNMPLLLNSDGTDALLPLVDSRTDLSEVKLTVWCALQCAENE
jgi:hypothetical protein